MKILTTPEAMRAWSDETRRQGRSIGLVPTMGALHEGHASLMRAAVEHNDAAVASIFVNPAQFGPNEDYEQYPRTFDADRAMADGAGVQALYVPTPLVMYPEGYSTYVDVKGLGDVLCGASRPGHFRGVTTVVAKLLAAVKPHRAYFGQKDAQQVAVIRRMTADLDLGVEIVEMPIIRDADGLALSSRNKYLSAEERTRALALSRALRRAQAILEDGERDAEPILRAVRELLTPVAVDYAELVDSETLRCVAHVDRPVLLAIAARVGATRLIDNLKFFP
jgi:pantoate--beta-alanine ligase